MEKTILTIDADEVVLESVSDDAWLKSDAVALLDEWR